MSSANAPKTVGINLLWLVPGTVGGSEESTIRSILSVADQLGGAVRLRAYVRADLIEAHPQLQEALELVVVPTAVGNKAARVLVENTWLPIVSRHDDLVHHAGGAVTFTGRGAMVTTIHDLQPLDMPGHFSAIKRRWLGLLLPTTVRRSLRIIVPSQFTADRCAELLGATSEQLVVLPHGYEAGPVGALPTRLEGRPFVLFPGIAYPHKRHVDAVEAHALVRDETPGLALVLTGRPGPEFDSVMERATELGTAEDVLVLGRIEAEVLNRLYTDAVALLFPSVYEGFGYPLLEAMTYGCPVIGIDTGAVSDVVGGAGLLVAAERPDQLADALRSVLNDPTAREALAAAGRERAKDFTYRANGLGLASVYCDALGIPRIT